MELEAQLVQAKADLKAQKEDVRLLVADLESKGRELSIRMLFNCPCTTNPRHCSCRCRLITNESMNSLGYETIQLQVKQRESLPVDIANLESTLQLLRETQLPTSKDASLSLPLPATLSLLSTREADLAELKAQLRALESALPRKTRELERLENELKPLELQRQGVTAAAKEARRRKEEALNGKGDELEARGRWWRGVEAGLKAMLEVES